MTLYHKVLLPAVSSKQSYPKLHSLRTGIVWTAWLVLCLINIISSTSILHSQQENKMQGTNQNGSSSVIARLDLQHLKSGHVQSILAQLMPKTMRWLLQEMESIDTLITDNPYVSLSTATYDAGRRENGVGGNNCGQLASLQQGESETDTKMQLQGNLLHYLLGFISTGSEPTPDDLEMGSSFIEVPLSPKLKENSSTDCSSPAVANQAVKDAQIDTEHPQLETKDRGELGITDYFTFIKTNISTSSPDFVSLSKIAADTDALIADKLGSFSSQLLSHCKSMRECRKFDIYYTNHSDRVSELFTILKSHTNTIPFINHVMPIYQHQKDLIWRYSLSRISLPMACDILQKEIIKPSLLSGYNSFSTLAQRVKAFNSVSLQNDSDTDDAIDAAEYVKINFQVEISDIPHDKYLAMIDELFQLNYEFQIICRIKGMMQLECASNIVYLTEKGHFVKDKLLLFLNEELLENKKIMQSFLSGVQSDASGNGKENKPKVDAAKETSSTNCDSHPNSTANLSPVSKINTKNSESKRGSERLNSSNNNEFSNQWIYFFLCIVGLVACLMFFVLVFVPSTVAAKSMEGLSVII